MSSSSSLALSWMSTATRSPNISTLRSSSGDRRSRALRRRRARSPRRNVSMRSGVPVATTSKARSHTPASLGSAPTSDSAQSPTVSSSASSSPR